MIRAMEDSKIGELFSNRKPFFVPTYQRAYAWEEDEVRDYASDVRKLLEVRRRDSDNPANHFFGGLVSIEHFVPNSGEHTYELVDGQQRLATFLVALSLLHSSFARLALIAGEQGDSQTKESCEARAQFVVANYLKYTDERGQNRQRLSLSKVDRLFYESLINGTVPGECERDSHQRLKTARQIIADELFTPILDGMVGTPKERFDMLDELKLCLTADCHAIHIISDNRREAYRLFSVLNDRGRTLTDGDLLRARTLEVLEGEPACQDSVETCWDEILGGTQGEIDHFLRSYYASHVGKRPPTHDLFDRFVEDVLECGDSFEPSQEHALVLEQKVVALRREWRLFQSVMAGEWPYRGQARPWDQDRLCRLLNIQRHDLSLPLVLAACASLDETSFVRLVESIDRVAFRYVTVVRAHPSSLMNVYYDHCRKIRNNPNSYVVDTLLDDLRALMERRAPDTLFETSLQERLVYGDTSANKAIRHFLTTLESYQRWLEHGASGKPTPDKTRVFDMNEYSVEHVYPDNAETPLSEMEEVKETLGNLCILSQRDNTLLDDKPFDEKKDRYRESRCALTSEIAEKLQWGPVEVDERLGRLVQQAKKVFTC